MKAQQHIYSSTVQGLYLDFCSKHPQLKCSSSLFWRCKPFYVGPATDRECEGCLCSKCLNPHCLYNTIRRYIKDLPISLTEYLTTLFMCTKDRNWNFPKMELVTIIAQSLMSPRRQHIRGINAFRTTSSRRKRVLQ